jgi:hypothetical protein
MLQRLIPASRLLGLTIGDWLLLGAGLLLAGLFALLA